VHKLGLLREVFIMHRCFIRSIHRELRRVLDLGGAIRLLILSICGRRRTLKIIDLPQRIYKIMNHGILCEEQSLCHHQRLSPIASWTDNPSREGAKSMT
jgi:hypothetical protein